MPSYLSTENLTAALQLRDLTDPADGKHAMQQLLGNVVDALTQSWAIPARWVRTSPLVAVEDNYDRLGFDPGAVTREARYTRYVNPGVMLRSHTTAALPGLLRRDGPRCGQRRAQRRAGPGLPARHHRPYPCRRASPGRPVATLLDRPTGSRRPHPDARHPRGGRPARCRLASGASGASLHRDRTTTRRLRRRRLAGARRVRPRRSRTARVLRARPGPLDRARPRHGFGSCPDAAQRHRRHPHPASAPTLASKRRCRTSADGDPCRHCPPSVATSPS